MIPLKKYILENNSSFTFIPTNESLKRCFLFLTAFILTELVLIFLWGKEIELFLNGF